MDQESLAALDLEPLKITRALEGTDQATLQFLCRLQMFNRDTNQSLISDDLRYFKLAKVKFVSRLLVVSWLC